MRGTRHLLKPMSSRMQQVSVRPALEAVLDAAAARPPSTEASPSQSRGLSLGGLRRGFVTPSALVLAASLLVAATVYAQFDISGTWELTFESPQGPATIDVIFKQVGESVDGSVATPLGIIDFTGALINNALTMASKLDLQGNKLDIAMKAKVSGDTMAGNLAVGGLGEIPWTAKRKPGTTRSAGTTTAPEAAAAADISGKWDIAMAMRGGATFATIATLKQAGEQITGSLNGQAGDEPVTGTMVGTALTLQFRAATTQGDVAIIMRGELGADGFSGKLSLPGVGEIDWTGTRTK